MRAWRWLQAMGVMFWMAALAGCGGSRGESKAKPGGEGVSASGEKAITTELRYMRWGLPEEIESERVLLQSFEQQHPGITVKLEYAAWEQFWTKLQAQFAAGTAPDVMLMGGEYLLDFMQRGLLEDLQPLLSSDTLRLSDYYDPPVKLFSREGKLYGVPRDCNTIAIYYNKTLFEQNQVPLPTAEWTWADYLTAAQKLTMDTNGDGRMEQWGCLAGFESIEENWGYWIWQNGGEILAPDHRSALLDQPVAIEALSFLSDLSMKYKVSPNSNEMASFTHGMNMFISGRVAMLSAGSWGIKAYQGIKDFAWDVAPLPRHKVASAPVNGLAYSLNAKSKHKQAAWQLAQFLVSRPAQELLAKSGTSIPAMRAVAESPLYLDGSPPGKKYLLQQIGYGHTLPFTPQFAKWEIKVREQLELVWLGQKTMPEACREANHAVNTILQSNP